MCERTHITEPPCIFYLQIGLASTFFHTNEILHYVHEQSDHEETSFAKASIVL